MPIVHGSSPLLATRLYEASRAAARRAAGKYGEGEHQAILERSIAAGAALEYLISTVLAEVSPLLLAADRDPGSKIALSPARSHQPLDLSSVKTLSFTDKAKLVKELHPSLRTRMGRADSVMGARNAATHAAIGAAEAADQALADLVVLVDEIHGVLAERDAATYWDEPFQELVEGLRHAEGDALEHRVHAKIAKARTWLDGLLANLDAGDRAALILRLSTVSGQHSTGDVHLSRKCPACQNAGVLSFIRQRADEEDPEVEFEEDDDGYPAGPYWVTLEMVGVPVVFECPVCRLDLEGTELDFVDMADEVELDAETMDADDFFIVQEPDEDWVRGR